MPLIYVCTNDESLTPLQKKRKALEKLLVRYDVSVKVKQDSWLMWFISKLLFFNPGFMTKFITAVGSTIYFPKGFIDDDITFCYVVPHELVHILDMKKRPWWVILYLMPQILGVFSLLSLFSFFNEWNLLWLFFLLFILPVPSYWRKKIEMRGYAMNMAVGEWENGSLSKHYLDEPPTSIVSYFMDASYYFMWPYKKSVKQELQEWLDIIHKDVLNEHIPVAKEIKEIFKGDGNAYRS